MKEEYNHKEIKIDAKWLTKFEEEWFKEEWKKLSLLDSKFSGFEIGSGANGLLSAMSQSISKKQMLYEVYE